MKSSMDYVLRAALHSALIALSLAGYAWSQNLVPQQSSWNSIFPPFHGTHRDVNHEHLGAEYLNVAQSVYRGEGFRSPFGVRSGPTAWVAPGLVYVQAFLLWLTGGSVGATAGIVVGLNGLVFALVAIDVAQHIARRGVVSPVVIAICIGIVLLANFMDNFQRTHDGWFLLAIMHSIVIAVRLRPAEPSIRFLAVWGLLGGIASLASPTILFAWLALTTRWGWQAIRIDIQARRASIQARGASEWICRNVLTCLRDVLVFRAKWHSPIVGWIFAIGIAFLIHSPWLVRNYVVFHRIVPIKSNGMFELEQSLLRDDDGVVDFGVNVHHPFTDRAEANKHASLGEFTYIAERGSKVKMEFSSHLSRYAEHVFNRLAAMTWYQLPQHPDDERFAWTWIARFLFALPLFVFVVSLWSRAPLEREQGDTLLLLAFFLLPYLLASYYSRYMIPAMGIRCLVLLWGLERCVRAGSRDL